MVALPIPGSFHVNTVRLPGLNPVDVRDLTTMEVVERGYIDEAFRFIRKYIPGCGNSFVMQSAAQIGIRESRRMEGLYKLKVEDIQAGTPFPDAVARFKWGHTDVHSGNGMQWSFEFIEGPYYIPYRALVPAGTGGLLVAGRCVSATGRDGLHPHHAGVFRHGRGCRRRRRAVHPTGLPATELDAALCAPRCQGGRNPVTFIEQAR